MKFPVTDRFLWDLYDFLEKAGDIYDVFLARPWKEVWSPELHKFRYEWKKKKDRKLFSRLVYYLKKKGYIKTKNLEEKEAVLLTRKGADKILKLKLKESNKKKRPDGKWQMVIFDIPERKRFLRDLLRENLYLLGYQLLQQSIWVCPYDVSYKTEIILNKYSLDQYVKTFLIKEIEV
ncbi:MAG: hypothetical protein PHF44_00370 [Candidatus Pacebacteria bacterium]|nr:hypothetical protein [Candidatus Paceibacterota bacterium]